MLERFIRLFDYEDWANRRTLGALEPLGDGEETAGARRQLAHILVAHEAWHGRLRLAQRHGIDFFPVYTLAEARAGIEANRAMWTAYLAELSEADLGRILAYQTSDGTPYETPIADILTHIINHSTYHRGQIAQSIRQLGGKPLPTDFILFTRVG